MKALVFDMDGTLADFYGVDGWLEYLNREDATPYEVASPLWDMDALNAVLAILRNSGWKIIITSWLSKNGSKGFNKRTRQAKRAWLEKVGFTYDEIHLVKYGRCKADSTRKQGGWQILIDDNAKIRDGWTLGETINPTNLPNQLLDLLTLQELQENYQALKEIIGD